MSTRFGGTRPRVTRGGESSAFASVAASCVSVLAHLQIVCCTHLWSNLSVPMYSSTNYNASCVPAAVDDYKNHQQQQQQKHYLPKLLFLHEFIVLKWNKFRLLYRHQGFVISTSFTSSRPLVLLHFQWSALINCTFAIGWRSIYLIVTV